MPESRSSYNKTWLSNVLKTITRNHRALHCNLCGLNYHMKCGQVTAREYKSIQLTDPKTWIGNSCLLNQPLSACGFDESDLLTALPFSSLSDDSFSSVIGTHTPPLSDVLPKDDECESPFIDLRLFLFVNPAKPSMFATIIIFSHIMA